MVRGMPVVSVAFVTLAASIGCSERAEEANAKGKRVELAVYAATSTREALRSLATAYERDHAVYLTFNFGSSSDLSRQLVAAAKADVFLSADEKEMDEVETAGLVASGTRRPLLSNQLVVVEPADGLSLLTAPFEPSQPKTMKNFIPAVGFQTIGFGALGEREQILTRGLWRQRE